MGYSRGQAAMEYLMTYGWAILVILIVLAILAFYLPQFIKAQDQCSFSQVGFTCGKPLVYSADASNNIALNVRVFNQNGQNVVIKKILCTNAPLATITSGNATTLSPTVTVPSGAFTDFNGVSCWKDRSGGNRVILAPNGDFRGALLIYYNFEDDTGSQLRQVQANVQGTVTKTT
ncbi:hypothetical protein J4450_00795 [Candidatus Micrarchaeota archaeon]|nr:hypothetical protein [Candidatus Micrarchaeota archaeon]